MKELKLGGVKREKVDTICPFTKRKLKKKQTRQCNRMREKDTPYYCVVRKKPLNSFE